MIKGLKHVLSVILIVLILALGASGCVVPLPQPSPPPPSTTPTSENSEVAIDPNWQPPAQGDGTIPQLSIPQVVKKVTPSVVAIQTEATAFNIFLQPVPQQGASTGVIIDKRGYIVTNNHVVENAEKITVTLSDGRVFDAIRVARDPWTDLAVIQIDADNLIPAELGDSGKLQVGEEVVAIGNALALEGGPTVTSGIVSYMGREIQEPNGMVLSDLIQTDAAINPGNSGGPLLNMAGQVVGINTAIAASAQNIGFAISISPALPVIEQLIQKGYVSHPWLGIAYRPVTPSLAEYYNLPVKEGVLIVEVVDGSPASRAGLKIKDIIIRFAGEEITTAEDLRRAITAHEVGDRVEIVFMQGDSERKTQATLGEMPIQ